jgi:hypothetical protein
VEVRIDGYRSEGALGFQPVTTTVPVAGVFGQTNPVFVHELG